MSLELQQQLAVLERRLEMLERGVELPVTGTWTPIFQGSGTAGTFTYGADRQGYYIRVSDRILFHGRVRITAISTPPTGTMRIGGLPFTANSNTGDSAVSLGYISQFNYATSAIQLTAIVVANTTYMALYESFDNIATVAAPAANFTNAACDIVVSGLYQI
jgi:hypothetical protein